MADTRVTPKDNLTWTNCFVFWSFKLYHPFQYRYIYILTKMLFKGITPLFFLFFSKCPNHNSQCFWRTERCIFSVPQLNNFVAWKLHFSEISLFVEKKFCSALLSRAFVCTVISEEGSEGGKLNELEIPSAIKYTLWYMACFINVE